MIKLTSIIEKMKLDTKREEIFSLGIKKEKIIPRTSHITEYITIKLFA